MMFLILAFLAETSARTLTANTILDGGAARACGLPQAMSHQVRPAKDTTKTRPRTALSVDTTIVNPDSTGNEEARFLTGWISIENLSKEAKQERIAEEARGLFANLLKSGSFISREATEDLNKKWQDFKVTRNWEGLRLFFEKEKAYRDAYREYAKKIQEQDGVRGQIEGLKKELERLKSASDILKQRKEMLRGLQASLVQDYQSRFANLPESVCYLGRIDIGSDENPDSLGAVISNVLTKQAIVEKSSILVSEVLQVIQGNVVDRKVSRTDAGRANIVDTYTWIRRTPRFTRYILSRIEVYPYDVIGPVQVAAFQSGGRYGELADRVEVFRVDEESIDSLSAMYMQNEAIDKFARSQLDIIRTSSARVKDQVYQLTEQFRAEKLEYENLLDEIDSELSRVDLEAARHRKELDEKAAAGQNLDLIVSRLNDALFDSKKAYEEFYRRKISFVNKSVVAKIQLAGSKSLSDIFANLAKSTYSVISDLKQAATKTTVLIESSTGSASILRKIEQREISYTPEVTRFRIVYLTSDDRSGEAYGYVNVAYEIRSTPDFTSLFVTGDTLIDRGGGRIWLRKKGLSSANYALEGMPPGFRLPTLEELQELNKGAQRYAEVNDNHPFTLLKWEMDFSYLSSKEFTNDKGQTLFKSFDFQTEAEEDISSGEGVYVLWLKPFQSNEQ
jgi:hypothetical protein